MCQEGKQQGTNQTKTPGLLELPITDNQHNLKGACQVIKRVAEGNKGQGPCRGQCHLKSGGGQGLAQVAGDQRPEGGGEEGAAGAKARGQEEYSLARGQPEARSGRGGQAEGGGNVRSHGDQVTEGFTGPGTSPRGDTLQTPLEQNRSLRL